MLSVTLNIRLSCEGLKVPVFYFDLKFVIAQAANKF